MESHTVATLVLLCIIWTLNIAASFPTFGDEFVHIKLHIPEEVPNTHGHLKTTHGGQPEYPHISRKVIHHYHHRRRPFKKQPHPDKEPLFESVILSELDKPHGPEHEQPFEEKFLVREQHSVPKVNTFTVIEETVRKPLATFSPKQHVDTFKVIESKIRQSTPEYVGKPQPHVETIELVEDNHYHYHSKKPGHNTQSHVETINLEEGDQHHISPSPQHVDTHQHYHNSQTYGESDDPGYTIQITKTPKHVPSEEYKDIGNSRYPYKEDQHLTPDSKPAYQYVYEKPQEEIVIKPQHNAKYSLYHENEGIEDYKYSKPGHHVHEPIEVIKTKYIEKLYHSPSDYDNPKSHYDYTTPHKELNEDDEKDYPKHPQQYGNHKQEYDDHTGHEPIKVIKTKYTEKYYHAPDYEKSKSHYDYTTSHKELNAVDEEYGDHRETEENINYHYSPKEPEHAEVRKPTATKSNHVEYGRPSFSVTQTVQGDHKKIPKSYVKTEEYRNPSASYRAVHTPNTKYENIDDLQEPVNNYDYSLTTDHTIEEDDEYPEEVTTGYNYKKPSSQSTTFYASQSQYPTKTYQFKASQQYQDDTSYEPQIHSTDNLTELRDYRKQREEAFTSSTSVHQNSLLDELSSANVEKSKLKSNIDWPEGVRAAVAETYTGYDSYSAAHVQGVGSGGYSYPTKVV